VFERVEVTRGEALAMFAENKFKAGAAPAAPAAPAVMCCPPICLPACLRQDRSSAAAVGRPPAGRRLSTQLCVTSIRQLTFGIWLSEL
jgi:hypothetical protein